MDRNKSADYIPQKEWKVALLAEGVDRNVPHPCGDMERGQVALLAEGVDRNKVAFQLVNVQRVSPSSRRAWIEIAIWPTMTRRRNVALLAEGVDRNFPSM